MVAHVLVPVDGSDPATEALAFALETYPDARITALHVVNPASAGGTIEMDVSYGDLLDDHKERGREILDEIRERADEAGLDVDTEMVVGEVSRSIVEYAKENEVDHVVVGSHGRTGLDRVIMGSVAEKVVRRSPVPVTVVR